VLQKASSNEDEVKPGYYGIARCAYSKCRWYFTKNKSFQKHCAVNFNGLCRVKAWQEEMRKRSKFYLKVKGHR
jgi:hypothetical protein